MAVAQARSAMKALLGSALLALMAVGATGGRAAAEPYPTRPVTFVVPFAPGGGTEFLARMLGQHLEQRLGKPFVIENRPGGGGVVGAPHHLFAQMFKSSIGVEMTHVPYRGSVPALTDVAAGHVQLMFCDIPPALGLVKEGKERALGVSTKERVSALPDLLPLAEQGVSGFDAASWQMVVAPAGTPKDIVEQLHGEIKQFMRPPGIRQHGSDMGLLPIDTPSVASLQIFVQTEITRWGKVVEQAGIAGSQ